jgi:hypothetical protein
MAKENYEGLEPVTFEENPLEYCKQVYAESKKRNDELREINLDNRMFYEGQDDELDARRNSDNIERSALFIHELKPAIDTRVSDIISKLNEREFPITFRPRSVVPTLEETAQALTVERVINEQLRDSGYLPFGFRDHVLSAEIYRSPATVKVGWENVYQKVAVLMAPSPEEVQQALMTGQAEPRPRIVWEDQYKGGAPVIDLLPPDQFLYEPHVSNLQKDSEYVAHSIWVSWQKLMTMADDRGWDKKLLNRMKKELQDADTTAGTDKTMEESAQDRRETPISTGFKDGKFLVVEIYVCDYGEMGEELVHQATLVGGKELVSKKMTPYKGIKFPFVCLTCNPFPGSLEGLSSIDVAKHMQRLYNECYNSFLDGVSYRIFPPLIREPGTEFTKKPKWGPGQIWDVTNPDGLRPLIENPGVMPDLPSLMQAISAKIRETLNAHDISQGFQSQEYEKATSTQLRSEGATKRSMPIRMRYGQALIQVAQMVLALNQQFSETPELFALPMIIDVPSLTSISDPEQEKQDSLLLLSQALQNPLYQSPGGQLKVRNLMEDVVQKFKKTDVARFVPSEADLKQDQENAAKLQAAMLDKQAVQEEMALTSSAGGQA